MTYSHAGTSYSTDRNGKLSSISRPGLEARYGSNGSVRSASFERAGGSHMNVSYGMHGERHIETIRADRTRVVSWGPHRGYVERTYRPGYVSRTYIAGGRTYVHVYRSYSYRNMMFYGYVPPVYYGSRFYGWAWNPWPAPVSYAWGWRRDPWFAYYGGYFAPAPAYSTAAMWLADYLMAENMRLAWENRQLTMAAQQQAEPSAAPEPSAYPSGGAILTPEAMQAVADEVKQDIAAEYGASTQATTQGPAEPMPAALAPNRKLFVVSSDMVVNMGIQECSLTPGDLIVRTNNTMISARNTVSATVLKSKPGDCAARTEIDIDVAALEEMHNRFQEYVDSGLKILAENQGKDGLPAAPPADARPSPNGEAPADAADSVETAITDQQQEATQALEEVARPGAGSGL
jgi:hypothetical protein